MNEHQGNVEHGEKPVTASSVEGLYPPLLPVPSGVETGNKAPETLPCTLNGFSETLSFSCADKIITADVSGKALSNRFLQNLSKPSYNSVPQGKPVVIVEGFEINDVHIYRMVRAFQNVPLKNFPYCRVPRQSGKGIRVTHRFPPVSDGQVSPQV